MLNFSNVSVRLGDLLLFKNTNLNINPGDRIGLVGPNGAGKSTLLRVITGDIHPNTGSLQMVPGTRVGYLRQGFADTPEGTLADILDIPSSGLFTANRELESALTSFDAPDADIESVGEQYQRATDRFESLGGYQLMAEIEALLDKFGLGRISLDRHISELSGGQKTRAGLAALLASRPDLLILDEPTNHLDASALEWLQTFLENYQGAFVLVSHDRGFLDATVTEIVAIDASAKSVRTYVGNYSDYAKARELEADQAEADWHRQQAEVAKMQRDIRAAEQKSRNIENSTIDYAVRKKAAKIARPAVVRKKKLERMLKSEDAADKPERSWGLSLNFAEPDVGARDLVTLQNVAISYDQQSVLEDVSLLVRSRERIAITGDNGSGKTSLLRVIADDMKPTSGHVVYGPDVKIGYLSQEQTTIDPNLTVLQQAERFVSISETDLRNELHKFLFAGETVLKRIGDLSYGERSRLMLALLVLRQTNLLLLDEPYNHLDIDAREQFEQALLQFNGTVLMVLHDRYSIDHIATREWHIADGKVRDIVMRSNGV